MRQSIDLCLEAEIGPGGLSGQALADALEATRLVLEKLRAAHAAASLPHLLLPFASDDLAPLEDLAGNLRDVARDVVVCGTGGSSLGGQALAQVAGWNAPIACALPARGPRLHFADNLDSDGLQGLLSRLDPARTHFLLVSKSGGTAETLMQALCVVQAYDAAGLGDDLARHVTVLTETAPGRNGSLLRLARARGLPVLEHLPNLGGRYSALSNVGLLPALIAGLDVRAVRAGAAGVVRTLLQARDPADCAPALGAAVNVALARDKGAGISVILAYADRLERFTRWYVQLWAESLGKQGKGTTPVAALGPVDQHSQLQLYLDGPADKLFTVLLTNTQGTGPRADAALADSIGAHEIAGRSAGDLVAAMQRATADTLAAAGRPVRTFHLDRVDAGSIGALMMHFMLETIIAAHLLGVDPFDQPAVERGKVLARRYLAEM